ncbi:C4-dicarboxylate ABC transporter [Alkalihalophilus pseudofirmus]|uniref:C4-dicarboxylate ABC transporter n=1 Tax=Alkalihalophilus marmarensis DSM 21297 TaxID=1188261 RepID=U6SNI4_9BACI|nr:TRAP transporter substrate-binding protein DctP [Alkalihalophilus marmarensis]ERN52201.1 C4-dicarboxylate ABC transporter [Alkalihalophilus marmarensis DSM 21297]OLS33927.1 C4-dicarboxylate ABC transporter [Alkalihalophilus pseudofirmus]
MFFKKRKVLTGAMAAALAVGLAACGSDDASTEGDNGASGGETYDWRFVVEETEGQVQYEYAQEFAELLNEKTDGQVNIDVYDFGSLGSEVDQVEGVQQGMFEMGIISPGFTGGLVAEGQVFSLQFLFPDDQEVTQEILNTSEALNTHLVELYEAQNLKPLAFMSEGAMQWTGNRELRTPDDFNGFKMRTQSSPLMLETYGAYGADPSPLSWSELYVSLDRGVVDGQENPIFFIEDASFHEVQDHMTISNHNTYVAMVTINPGIYNDLPEDIRTALDETVEEMRDRGFEIQDQLNEELLDSIVNDTDNPTEVIELTEEERAEFRELQLPIRDFFRDEIIGDEGREMFDLLLEEIAEHE